MEIQTFGANTGTGQTTAKSGDMGKDEFLKLLTTQLAYQDPLDPMDNTAFVSQMAEFSGLEQLMQIGSGMEQLAMAQAVANGSNMVGFIGKTIVYAGDTISYQGSGSQDLNIELGDAANKVTVTVYDDEGNLVKTIEAGPMAEGAGAVSWDGTDVNGHAAKAGEYTYKVSAEDDNGGRVAVATKLEGQVTGVTYENGFPELLVGGTTVSVGSVIEVSSTVVDPESEPTAMTASQPLDSSESTGEVGYYAL
jgi:flagellar basal-body rod modification protein FlgD